MAIQAIETTEVTQVVPFLEDVQAEFVSIVDHAATREPFRVIKVEKGQAPPTELVLSSLLVPNTLDVAKVIEHEMLASLSNIRIDNARKFESWTQYGQIDPKRFDRDSFTIKPLADTGAYAVVGRLRNATKQGTVLESGIPMGGGQVFPTDDMHASVATDMVPVNYSFSDLFYRELDGLVAIVEGTMAQSAADPKRRKTTIMNALNTFGSFLSMAIDAVGSQAAKLEKPLKDAVPVNDCFSELFHHEFDSFVATVKGMMADGLLVQKAEWTTQYINSLPNSSFAVIETGYKDGMDKKARHLPVKDDKGEVDIPHLRNALARFNQIKSVLGNDTDAELRARAQKTLEPYAKEFLKAEQSVTVSEGGDTTIDELNTTKQEIDNPEIGGMDMFADKDEMRNFIIETVKEALKAEAEPVVEKLTEETEKTEGAEAKDSPVANVDELKMQVTALNDAIKDLTEKQEQIGRTVLGTSSSPDDVIVKKDGSKGRFTGVFKY